MYSPILLRNFVVNVYKPPNNFERFIKPKYDNFRNWMKNTKRKILFVLILVNIHSRDNNLIMFLLSWI